ncbi:hypothetical protein QO259_00795 [Salinicola sp. JS01]|uniref:hypothetical protein n=1 Tax=Salinicola sp. JS01 TaxID=3050071 RepID=UPI00255BAE42|nr:hypothetical protein [Salinicola sp. JS01]WIX33230.1 hypothetical protein QO259_00795 [Salinicola sp. JS01]
MGFTVPYQTDSRDELVNWLLEHQHEPDRCEILDHSRRGNVLYVVFHNRPQAYRFIAVFLLQGPSPAARRAGDHAWGYKDLDESMGPIVKGCPERLLRQSDVQCPMAVAWREACRFERQVQAERRQLARCCRSGDRLHYRLGCNQEGDVVVTIEFVRPHSPTFFIGRDEAGQLWRYRWTSVVIDPPKARHDSHVA